MNKVDKLNMHSRRIVSHRNIYNIIRNSKDFHIRSHGVNPFKAIYWLCIIIVATFFLLYCTSGMLTADLSKYSLDNLAVSMMVIGSLFLVLITAATYLIYRMQRMLIITEFQNLLFASAMRKDTLLYAIISKDSILYIDAPCMEHIGKDWKKITMVKFFERLQLNNEQCAGCLESLILNREFSATCYKDRKEVELILTPLERPIGFFSVSARKTS